MGRSVSGRGWAVAYDLLSAAALPIALGLNYERMGMVCKAIEGCAGQEIVPEHFGPFLKSPIACDDQRTAFIALADDVIEVLGGLGRERVKAEII